MKKILFASVIAFMAIFATSCKDKNAGDAPKARFTYAVEGLTVTFTNQSVDAEAYAWDFGDGSAVSAEENPVHLYAAEGSYKVTLTAKNKAGEKAISQTVVVEKPLFNLKIDGDFADWNNLPAELLAEASVDDWAYLENLYKIRFISDPKKVYFYMEFNGEAEEGVDIVGPIDMMIDIDGDAAVGMDTWLWSPSGVDLLIEGNPYPVDDPEWPSAGYQDAGVYQWIGSTPDEWLFDPLDISGAIEASGVVEVRTGVKAFEGSILRSAIPGLKAFNVGVFTSAADWSGETGSLPQINISPEDGSNNPQPMLQVKLN